MENNPHRKCCLDIVNGVLVIIDSKNKISRTMLNIL